MKKVTIKYSFYITLVIFLFFLFLRQFYLHEKLDFSMKVASSFIDPVNNLDTSRILYQTEYMLLDNIYSPLVEYSSEGKLVSGLAEKFEWDGNNAVFKIRPNIRTISGEEITAEDAAVSIKRLLILQSNTHGNLKQILCKDLKLLKTKDFCPGIQVLDKHTMVLRFPKREFFLFPELTSIDFAVIPKKAIDPVTLKIIDYKNTSGPYYVDKDLGNGYIELKANPFHYHFSSKMPQKIKLIPSGQKDSKESIFLFSNKSIDHITTKDPSAWMPYEYAKAHKYTNIHETYPIHMYVIVFTNKGMNNLTKSERFLIGQTLKMLFLKKYLKRPGYQEAWQIIPIFGEGRLLKTQEEILKKSFKNLKIKILNKKFTCWNYFGAENAELKNFFPNGNFIWSSDMPTPDKDKNADYPDCYLYQGDASFYEDIGFISYYMSLDFWDIPKNKKMGWIRNYENNSSKKDRLNILRELHFKSLLSGKIFPIAFRPYYALTRKPWRMDFPKYFAKNPLWKISKN